VAIKYYPSSSGTNAQGSSAYITVPYTVSLASPGWTPVITGAITRYQITVTNGNGINIIAPASTNDNDTLYIRLYSVSSGTPNAVNITNIVTPSLGTATTFPFTFANGLEYHLIIQYSSLRSQWQLVQFLGGY